MSGSSIGQNVGSLPRALEELARDYPESTWATVPNDAKLTKGWRNITYKELGHAVDGLARWVEAKLGSGDGKTVVAFMGVNDTRYTVSMVGLMKAGYIPILPSTRNSGEGQKALFESTACRTLLHSDGVETQVEVVKAVVANLQTLQLPSFDELRDEGSKAAVYHGHYSEAENAHALIIHTSGSTSLPKPIYYTNGALMTMKNLKDLSVPNGRQHTSRALLLPDKPVLAMAPFFHAMGVVMMCNSIMCRVSLVLIPKDKPPTGQLILNVLEQTAPSTGLFPPAILEQIVDLPGGLDALAKLDTVLFGGAPLAQQVGDKISDVTTITTSIGSTECFGIIGLAPADKRDWQFFEWAPEAGVDMQPDGDSLYEMVIKPVDRKYQAILHTFPDVKEWRTKDLFARHPTKPDLWLYRGRKDDVLVLSNGEKFNPVLFEKTMESHPLVQGALVVGQGRFQTGLLIEPVWSTITPDQMDPDVLLDTLWPVIVEANKSSPGHGQVWRSKVAISKRDKPFRRAPKGSIMRSRTTQLYQAEIEAMYSNETNEDEIGKLPVDANLETIKEFLRNIFRVKGFGVPDQAADESDFFSFGVDSLQVLALSSTLNHARGSAKAIPASVIYSHSSIRKLAEYLHHPHENGSVAIAGREEVMADMVDKYTSDLTTRAPAPQSAQPARHDVILTGSTGSLGGYILQELIESPSVADIFCLNRSSDAERRQAELFANRSVEADFAKVTFLHTDFSQHHFGLSDEVYGRLLQSVDLFVHNAWAVDFNKSLASFEEVHVAGTRRCVDFSLESKYGTHIIFVSSIASVQNWLSSHPGQPEVPELSFKDNNLPARQGYGESKHVASLILAAAADEHGVKSTIIRAGQLAGPSGQGSEWNRHEWFPSTIISSKALGVVPSQLGSMNTIDWVPMDLAARCVVDIADARSHQEDKVRVAHLVNPRTSSWNELVPTVQTSLSHELNREIRVVSFEEWVAALKALPTTKEQAELVPGVKLLDFYQGLLANKGEQLRLATTETVKMSSTMSEMKPVDSVLLQKWLEQWQ